jgi:hypothetical protein
MKKIGVALLACTTFLALNVTAVSAKTAKSGKYKIYDTKITTVSETSDHEWLVKGTTSAPKGSKIIVTPSKSSNMMYGDSVGQSTSSANWAKVKNGAFKVVITPNDVTDSVEAKTGQKTDVAIFAIPNYKKSWTDTDVSHKIIKAYKKEFDPAVLSLTKGEADYINNPNSDSSSKSSSTSDSSDKDNSTDLSSYESVTYDQIARNPDDYEGKSIKIIGQVMQVENSDDESILLVWENDDSNSIVMVRVYDSDMPTNGKILEDDEVTVYGTGYGTKKYDTALGSTNEVPLIETDTSVVDNGKSSNAY